MVAIFTKYYHFASILLRGKVEDKVSFSRLGSHGSSFWQPLKLHFLEEIDLSAIGHHLKASHQLAYLHHPPPLLRVCHLLQEKRSI